MFTDTYIFVHIPRTAGRSILAALGQPFRCEHRSLASYEEELGTTGMMARYRFSTVRNPWDRAASWYGFFGGMIPRDKGIRFGDWLRAISTRKRYGYRPDGKFALDQLSYLRNRRGNVAMNKIMQFEKLHADFSIVSTQLGISFDTLPTVGVNDRAAILRQKLGMPLVPTDYHELFTEQWMIDQVAEWDAAVISQFGYVY